MNLNLLAKSIENGIRRNFFVFFRNSFLAYATIWTVIEPIITFSTQANTFFKGIWKFVIYIIISLVYGIFSSRSPNDIVIKYQGSTIKILFGDLFAVDGIKVVPVSRFFFETDVIQTSLQNKIIQMFLQSEEGVNRGVEKYKEQLASGLQNYTHQEVSRFETVESFYKLGTTASLSLNGETFLLFALTQTELKGHIPPDNCNVTALWNALETFWIRAKEESRGRAINIPLVGSGASGITLQPQQVLEIVLLSIVNAIANGIKPTSDEIRIVLHEKFYEDIDLSAFKKFGKPN